MELSDGYTLTHEHMTIDLMLRENLQRLYALG